MVLAFDNPWEMIAENRRFEVDTRVQQPALDRNLRDLAVRALLPQ
jgi:hypothetical protein